MIKRKWLLSGVLLLLFWGGYGTVSAVDITTAELNQLETNLSKLSESNENKQQLLNQQSEELKALQNQIEQSKALNNQMNQSLENANKYLSECEKEYTHKLKVKNRQLRTWQLVSGLLLIYAIKS